MTTKPKKQTPPLEGKHWAWIVGWALEKCAENIERAEMDIVRHERFKDEPPCNRFGLSTPRAETIKSQQNFLAQYRRVYAELVEIKNNISAANAEEAARVIVAAVRGERRDEKDVTPKEPK